MNVKTALRRILITGSAGFVGRHLLATLQREFRDAELIKSEVDVSDASAVTEIVKLARPEGCIHLAAVTSVKEASSNSERAWLVNLHGTLAVARAVMEYAPGCVFLFASSSDAYGGSFTKEWPLDETAALSPLNTYAATKAAADLALNALANEGLRAVRLRLFNHTGPGQSAHFVVSAFARQLARMEAGLEQPVMQVGALDSHRDFLDVRDVCLAYVKCLRHADGLTPGTILNIASGTPRRIADVLKELIRLARVEVQVRVDCSRLRAADIPFAWGDARRARALLGWSPEIPWEQTLSNVLEDWRARVHEEPSS